MHYLLQILIIHHLYITVLVSYKPCRVIHIQCNWLPSTWFKQFINLEENTTLEWVLYFYRQIQQFHRLFGSDISFNWHPPTRSPAHGPEGPYSPILQSHCTHRLSWRKKAFWKDLKVICQKKIKSIMIIHIAKTRAQVKSV